MNASQDRIVGVILAGGQSRRMGGGDKCLLDLGGVTLLQNAIRKLKPQVADLVINANGGPERFASLGVPVAPDTIGGFPGPLAGLLAGMRWAASHRADAHFIATVACDTPFFPDDMIARLSAAIGARNHAIAIAASGGASHQVFGLWPVALADDLEGALNSGVRKVLDWANRHDAMEVDFGAVTLGDQAIDPFFNINTPEDLTEAREVMASAQTKP